MLVKKQHFCNQLSGQLFKCKNCNTFPVLIREIREINTDELVNIELISQSNDICSVTYESEVQVSRPDNTYDYILCRDCSQLVETWFLFDRVGFA